METDKPCLLISTATAEVLLKALHVEAGLPLTVTFEARVRLDHPTGEIVYTATDVVFGANVFDEFIDGLRNMLKGEADQCAIGAVGDKLKLSFAVRAVRKIAVDIRIREFQPDADLAVLVLPTYLSDLDSLELLHRSLANFVAPLHSWIELEQVLQRGT